MELSVLLEIFGALSVGAFTIFGLFYIYWTYRIEEEDFVSWLQGRSFIPKGNIGFALIILVFYGLGFLVQDITDHLTDSSQDFSEKKKIKIVSNVQGWLLGTEKDHRFESIVKKEKEGEDDVYSLTGLGHGVFNHKYDFVLPTATNSKEVDFAVNTEKFFEEINVCLKNNDESCNKKLDIAKSLINLLYYKAKNWSYSQKTYYDELKAIQNRIDFTRSMFLIASWFIVVILVPAIPYSKCRGFKGFNVRVIYSLAFLIIVCVLSLNGYENTEKNFNERVFGNYISYLDNYSLYHPGKTFNANVGNNEKTYSVLWMQLSSEYKAVTKQIYQTALLQLHNALNDKNWTAALEQINRKVEDDSYAYSNFPPAIIVDIDETVLDNSPFQAKLLKDKIAFNLKLFDSWVSKSKAKPIPGSIEFINKAYELGIEIFYITNRKCMERYEEDDSPCPQESDTINNLKSIGINGNINFNHILLKNENKTWVSEKTSRRKKLISTHRILLIIGDDLADFIPDVRGSDITLNTRNSKMLEHEKFWGKKWFILPNPCYGSWEQTLSKDKHNQLISF